MKLAVRTSEISGRGVYAEKDIRQGEHIHRLGGERVSLLACVARVATGAVRMDDPLPIGRYTYIVLDELSICFNHSCDANAGIVGESDLIALRDIPKGSEITFDYSMTVRASIFTRFWRMPCRCGAPTCRGTIGDVGSVPHQHLQAYLRAGALQDFILAAVQPQQAATPAAVRTVHQPCEP